MPRTELTVVTDFKTLFIPIGIQWEKRLKKAKEIALVQADDFFFFSFAYQINSGNINGKIKFHLTRCVI